MKSSTQVFASLVAALATLSQSAIAIPSSRVISQSTEIALAQSTSSNCPAIVSVIKRLKRKNSNATINIRRSPAKEIWRDAPKGDILKITTQNSFYNDKFEMSNSKIIVDQCLGIIAVSFNQYGTDGQAPYGLINGRVNLFQCPKGMTYENSPFRWGYFCGA